MQVLAKNRIKITNATMYYYFPSPGINDSMYYLSNQMYYLESIAKIIKVSSSVEHQRAGTYQ